MILLSKEIESREKDKTPLDGTSRKRLEALLKAHDREGKELEPEATKAAVNQTPNANELNHLADANRSVKEKLEKLLYYELRPKTKVEIGLGSTVKISVPCPGGAFFVLPEVPEIALASNEAFEHYVFNYFKGKAEEDRVKKNPPQTKERYAATQLRTILWGEPTPYSLQQALAKNLCSPAYGKIVGALLNISPEDNPMNGKLAAQRQDEFKYATEVANAKGTLRKFFGLDANAHALNIDYNDAKGPVAKTATDLQRMVIRGKSADAKDWISKLVHGTKEQRDLYKGLLTYYRNFPSSNPTKRLVWEPALPKHFRAQLATKNGPKELLSLMTDAPDSLIAHEFARSAAGDPPLETTTQEGQKKLAERLQKAIHNDKDRIASQDTAQQKTPDDYFNIWERENGSITLVNHDVTNYFKPLMEAKDPKVQRELLANPKLDVKELESFSSKMIDETDGVLTLERARYYYLLELSRLRNFQSGKNTDVKLLNCPYLECSFKVDNLFGKEGPTKQRVALLARGLESMIHAIDNRLRGHDPEGFDSQFPFPDEKKSLEREVAEIAKLDAKRLRENVHNNIATNIKDSNYNSHKGPEGTTRDILNSGLGQFEYFIRSFENGVRYQNLIRQREAKQAAKDSHTEPPNDSLPATRFSGLPGQTRSALKELPPVLYDIVDTIAHSRGKNADDLTYPEGFYREASKLIQTPWPGKILSFVASDPTASKLYARRLQTLLDAYKADPGNPNLQERAIFHQFEGDGNSIFRPYKNLAGLVEHLPSLKAAELENYRTWAVNTLMDLEASTDNKGVENRLKGFESMKGKTLRDESWGNQAAQLLTFLITAIDERGDKDEGEVAKFKEAAKGGSERFNPMKLSQILRSTAEAEAKATVAQKKYLQHLLDLAPSKPTDLSRGLSAPARARIYQMSGDDLHLTQVLEDRLVKNAPEVKKDDHRQAFDAIIQGGSSEQLRQVVATVAPEELEYENLANLDLAEYRNQIKKDIRETGRINPEHRGQLLSIAQDRLQREWRPDAEDRAALLSEENGAKGAYQKRMISHIQEFVGKAEDEVRNEITLELIEDFKKKHPGKDWKPILGQMSALVAQSKNFASDGGKDKQIKAVLSNPDVDLFLKKVRKALGNPAASIDKFLRKQAEFDHGDKPEVKEAMDKFIPLLMQEHRNLMAASSTADTRLLLPWLTAYDRALAKLPVEQRALVPTHETMNRTFPRAYVHDDTNRVQALLGFSEMTSGGKAPTARSLENLWSRWKQERQDAKNTPRERAYEELAKEREKSLDETQFQQIVTRNRMGEIMQEREPLLQKIKDDDELVKKPEFLDKAIPAEQRELKLQRMAADRAALKQMNEELTLLAKQLKEHEKTAVLNDGNFAKRAKALNEKFSNPDNRDLGPKTLDDFLSSQIKSTPLQGTKDLLVRRNHQYFEWREKAERLGKILANASNPDQDPRYQKLLAEAKSGAAGYPLKEADLASIIGEVGKAQKAFLDGKSEALAKVSPYGIDPENPDPLKLKLPVDEVQLKKVLDEYTPFIGVSRAEPGQETESSWNALKRALVGRWQQEGLPEVLELHHPQGPIDENGHIKDLDPSLDIAVRVSRNKDGEYHFVFEDAAPLRKQANLIARAAKETRNQNSEKLKDLRYESNHAYGFQQMHDYFLGTRYAMHKDLGKNMQGILDNVAALKRFGTISVDPDGLGVPLPSKFLGNHYESEYKNGVIVDVNQTIKNIQNDEYWRGVSTATTAALIASNFIPGVGQAALLAKVLHSAAFGAGLHLGGDIVKREYIPLLGFNPDKNFNWSAEGPGILKSGATFGAGAGLGAVLQAQLALGETSAQMLGMFGGAFGTHMGADVYNSIHDGSRMDWGDSLKTSLMSAGQTAMLMFALDQKLAGISFFKDNEWAQWLLSFGTNQSITAGMTAYEVNKMRTALQTRKDSLEEKLKGARGSEAIQLKADLAEIDKQLAETGYFSTIAQSMLAEVGPHSYFASQAVRMASMSRLRKELTALAAPHLPGEVTPTFVEIAQRAGEAAEPSAFDRFLQRFGKRPTQASQLLQAAFGQMSLKEMDGMAKSAETTPEGESAKALKWMANNMRLTPERLQVAISQLIKEGTSPRQSLQHNFSEVTKAATETIEKDLASLPEAGSGDPEGNDPSLAAKRNLWAAELVSLKPEAYIRFRPPMGPTSNDEEQNTLLFAAAREKGLDGQRLAEFSNRYRAAPTNGETPADQWDVLLNDYTNSLPTNPAEQLRLVNEKRLTPEDILALNGDENYLEVVQSLTQQVTGDARRTDQFMKYFAIVRKTNSNLSYQTAWRRYLDSVRRRHVATPSNN